MADEVVTSIISDLPAKTPSGSMVLAIEDGNSTGKATIDDAVAASAAVSQLNSQYADKSTGSIATDANDLTTSGHYIVGTPSGGSVQTANLPSDFGSGWGAIDVLRGTSTNIAWQRLRKNGELTEWQRRKTSIEWGDWERIPTRAEVDALSTELSNITFGTGAIIPENSDLDDYNAPGVYSCMTKAMSQTLSNAPVEAAFRLEVKRTASVRCIQFLYPNVSTPIMYLRTNTGSWSSWYSYSGTPV